MKRSTLTLNTLLLILLLSGVGDTFAQRFGGFGINTGGNTTTSTTGTQRTYYSHGTIGEAIIEADHDSRSIIVITDEYTNEHIKKIIENLDRPVQQVLIKVVFVEVTYRDELDVGVEGEIDINNDRPGSNVFETAFGLAAQPQGGFYRILERDVNVTIRAISEKGRMEILSRPSILTRNNQEAIITVGKEVPLITSSRITEDGLTINTVEYEDIGIILRVTPFITKKGLVEMILSPEISSISEETVPISTTVDTPVFSKRAADTVVVTPNGQTVVIGGMMEDNISETKRKIPLLGDIPLLGMAFQRTIKDNYKTELMIFLTPYVVEGPANLSEMTQNEKRESELLPETFSEQELDKYIKDYTKGLDEPEERLEAVEEQSEDQVEANDDEKNEDSKPSGFLNSNRNSKGRPM